jgi:hypothetical protein
MTTDLFNRSASRNRQRNDAAETAAAVAIIARVGERIDHYGHIHSESICKDRLAAVVEAMAVRCIKAEGDAS